MLLYLLIFLIPVFAYISGDAVNRNKAFLVCYMGALALFVGLADMFGGYDRYIYGEVFDSIADGVTNGMGYRYLPSLLFYEPGYSALSYVIALVTENRYVYIFIVTMLIYYCMYKAFEKNMPNYPLAMILFLGMVFYFTFTYLRQVLAFSVAWLGVTYLIENKRWKFFLIVLLVALLHKSGIVFAALYFLPLKKFKPGLIIMLLGICAVLGFSGVTGALYDAYANVSEAGSMNTYSTSSGVRGAYILEVVFFELQEDRNDQAQPRVPQYGLVLLRAIALVHTVERRRPRGMVLYFRHYLYRHVGMQHTKITYQNQKRLWPPHGRGNAGLVRQGILCMAEL